ncbi:hypothetical protein [Acinetobacter sp. CFCC 10889]|uniref:hypothetical protein n=1 Tax=Acinetobacter sp. CFCC 10889 TaxID=1775557 RepID=UPI000DCFB5B4|nr:hypothetical protein [Acinetobacter sp. CFCC 10889]
MNEQIEPIIEHWKAEHSERIFFLTLGLGAEIHWFFTQALEALKLGLYLPACTSFINGIESSIRVIYAQSIQKGINHLNDTPTLSNSLLIKAQSIGMPITFLKFPNEAQFQENLVSTKPKTNVEIVRVRHNLAHGNIFEYINKDLGEDNIFFTPECCRNLAFNLYEISKEWCAELAKFKQTK